VRTIAWSVVLLGWSNVLVGAMRASGAALVPALLSMAAIVGVELPIAVALEARFGLAGVFWACPAGLLAMLALHGLYYYHKEKKDGLFSQPGVPLGAAGRSAPST
jgi:Na+-driven multidrug efflux pump